MRHKMSKGKRAKSGSAHDINKWENGLIQASLNEDAWKTCVFFLVSNKPEDDDLINISSAVISTGLRKLFSVISKEQLYREVKEFTKAISSGGGKGKTAVKLPEFVEICEQVKPFIDQGEDIPSSLLAKLLKFKLLQLKTKDIERREEADKEKAKSASGKKGDKSPDKRSKSPKKKGKKGEAERPPSPKKDTKLKKRGEVEDTFKTIDDEPDEEGSPQHYVLIHGFLSASTLHHLANIGVHVNAIIKLQQEEYRCKPQEHPKEEMHEDVEEEGEEVEVAGVEKDVEATDESSKDEEELAKFWSESDELVLSAPTGHKLKDIAKYEVTVSNTLPVDQSLDQVEAEKKNELGTAIFEKIANVCYDMLDHHKSYQRFLAAMKLLHVPVHAANITTDVQEAVTTDSLNQVEIDTRYFNHLLESVPDESISVPLVLHCLLEQVVVTVDETDPFAKQKEIREDGLDNDLAAHINTKMANLALTTAEKQEILEETNVKKRDDNAKIPVILEHNDKLSQRLHYLEDISILDGLDTERAMLEISASRDLDMFPRRTTAEFMESNARFHQFIQHCSFPSAEDVSYLLKKYTFEGIPLKSVDGNGNVVEQRLSSYKNPWDDPYSDFMKYNSAREQGMIKSDVDPASVSAAVNLVSYRNLNEWCYVEEFDQNTFTQVLEDVRHSYPFVDTYYHKHDDTLLLVHYNPIGKQLFNTSCWNVKLLSNVGFRNYLEHISSMIREWNLQQDRLEEENNKTPTPVPPTPEPPKADIKIGSRYGLKTRAEIAALKAEEDDKGKKKGKRSARSRTPKSGKKGSATEKKGSSTKSRVPSSGSPGRTMKGSKGRLANETETQPEVDDEALMDDEERYDFLGYDVGDDLIHVTGVQTSMFPCDGGEIRVEKTQYVRGPCSVSTTVHKDGDILKLYFLEPIEEILPEQPSEIIASPQVEANEDPEQTEDSAETLNEPSDEGVEKSEFEANEKTASFHQDVVVENDERSPEPAVPAFCTHASFVAQLNDGMVITSSGFGPQGTTGKQGESAGGDCSGAAVPLDPSPPPKPSSPKSRKKNEEEAKRLEELRLVEEKQRAEVDARKLKELQESMKNPFHEIFVSCPDGLHVSYRNDENYSSVDDSGGVVVRQRYPVKSRGLHECEATRGEVAMRELSRSIMTDGTVIKMMLDNSIEVLKPDGSVSTCPVFPEKSADPAESLERHTLAQLSSNRKGQASNNAMTSQPDEVDDQLETTSELNAHWTTVTADGERLLQCHDGTEKYLDTVKLSVATCPVSHQIYKTREDNVITVIRPDGTQIVEHSDGTRVTTFYDVVRTEVRAADKETGEEAEYESHVCKHVKVECEGFATVVMETEHGSSRTLFGNGSCIRTETNGECLLEKSDRSKLYFDIKGNIAYLPQDLSSNAGCLKFSDLDDNSLKDRPGVYLLRTTSQTCCELSDQQGNVFLAYTNGETKVTESENGINDSAHVPRFFVMRRDGTGYELLRHQDVGEYLKAAQDDATTAVLRTPVEGLPGVTGITVLKPFPGGVGKTWRKEKDEKILIPVGLRERDFKMFPAKEFKKDGPRFGCNAGLNVGNMRKTAHVQPQITCPKVLVLRHLTKYEPTDSTHRETISAAFQQYGDYVTKLRLQADNYLPVESRDAEEIDRANNLANKHEAVKSNKIEMTSDKDGLRQDYVTSVTPVEQPPPPSPVWKRPPAEWERDRIELAKLNYGKHALRYQEVPPYFETAQGQAFLTGLKAVPDMEKLSADLDKQACPSGPPRNQPHSSSTSSTPGPVEAADHSNLTQESSDRNDSKSLGRYSSAVLEDLDPDGRHSPGEAPVQSSTPFASRPINPTPAQAAGRPTPITSRPTNPTPRQASNVMNSEGILDSPRHVHSEYTPLEALVETQHEVSTVEDNDTALDMMSSTRSHYEDDGRQKSLHVDVTGSPRKEAVRLPNSILGGKPGALPNTQFSTIEEPARRKVQTVSVVGKTGPVMRGFELFPPEVEFGVLKEGCTYIHTVSLKNIGIDSCRFKIRQPPPSTGLKVLFTPGPVAAGMNTKLNIEIFAVAVGVSGESGIGSIGHHIEIVGETDIIYLPVTATILTAYEYDNRSASLPRGFHSRGTQMISNRPPSREAIRPQRDHVYSNIAKPF
ncbi:sperm-associated antigen 17-like isoform X2 [Dendronephthya gigantea]|uniref:sperm-associated antigen 17-like isoform X2 n=1 Tax=Dendronephthya gigantea TaxID=151771 RepID=UPI001068EE47|nr:sperm-associated antigen 17-like isoform X2 [Dendronephthya gigantea]